MARLNFVDAEWYMVIKDVMENNGWIISKAHLSAGGLDVNERTKLDDPQIEAQVILFLRGLKVPS